MKIAINCEVGSSKDIQYSPSLSVKKNGIPSILLTFQIIE
jgi:hypothetical protein